MGARNVDIGDWAPGVVAPAARQREARIVQALARPGELEDVLRRAPGLTQAATLADLRCLVEEGKLVQHIVYALPGQRVEVR